MLDHLILLFIFAIVSTVLHWFAWKKGFFQPLAKTLSSHEDTGRYVLIVFAYFILCYLALPYVFIFILSSLFSPILVRQLVYTIPILSFIVFLWFLSITAKRIDLSLYTFLRRLCLLSPILSLKTFLVSILIILLLAYPTVAFVDQFLEVINLIIFKRSGSEQNAVIELKRMVDSPIGLSFSIISIAVIAPLIEEFIFRGCLYTYLRKRQSFSMAAVISSIAFAILHFSLAQGIGNIPLLFSLFVFSIYTTYIYEKLNNLFASILLHSIFNTINIIHIILVS